MRTRKPIATISYNHEEFLRGRLDDLKRRHLISDYMFIPHKKEQDEAKDHIHLWIRPNQTLDTMQIQEEMKEPNPKERRGCIDFVSSDIDEWILYTQHYKPYLASKGQNREYHYQKEDFRFADEDNFQENYVHAFRGSKWAERNQLLQQLNDGTVKFSELIKSGQIPLNMASQLNAFKYLLADDKKVFRNGRAGHEEDEEDDNEQARTNAARSKAREIRKRKEQQKQLELEAKEGGFMECPEEDPFAEGV